MVTAIDPQTLPASVSRERPVAAADVSVVLGYYVEAAFGDVLRAELGKKAGKKTAGHRIAHLLQNEIRIALKERLPLQPGVDLNEMLSDPTYLARIGEVIRERLIAGSDAPSLRIAPKPLGRVEADPLLKDGVNFGLIFGAETIYFQDTVQAFQTDEIRSRPERAGSVHVLGVHADWLSDDGRKAHRALMLDATGSVLERSFAHAVALDVVATLHLPRSGERDLHKKLSAQYEHIGLPQINPYEASRRADDKVRTHRLWEGRVPSVRAVRILGSNPERTLGAMLEAWPDQGCAVVAQPNMGTEGDRVARFEATAYPEIARYIRDRIGSDSEALIREERGNVRYFPETEKEKGYRRIALRINVAWNGRDFVAESGYAQVAPDEDHFVASRGQGGTLVPLSTALAHLYRATDGGWVRTTPNDGDLARIRQTAVYAAQALNEGLAESEYVKLLGIDLLIEADEAGGFSVLALEANPRPAGLAQSWELPRTLRDAVEPKITFGLFEFIRSRGSDVRD
ncbi:MAG: hypothetical protein J7M27_09565 [Candidatus Latescibacteria bacterium]|nr:hypothetical protein [Candidatus Latescibacterota bacterium]